MQLAKSLSSWFGVCLGMLVCGFPVAATAIEFNPPKRGLPGRREGAGTRSPERACVGGKSTLTIVLPETNVGLTTEAYPRFFWYVPKTNAKTARFILFQGTTDDPEQEILYDTTIAVPGSGSILSVRLPNDGHIPPLEIGKDYHWAVALQCNPTNPMTDIYTSGWIQRVPVEMGLGDKLKEATPSDRIDLYAQSGLWMDTVSALSDLRCKAPGDAALTQSWNKLLKAVKLEHLVNETLGTCTSVEANQR